jgi:hypothetical protein
VTTNPVRYWARMVTGPAYENPRRKGPWHAVKPGADWQHTAYCGVSTSRAYAGDVQNTPGSTAPMEGTICSKCKRAIEEGA